METFKKILKITNALYVVNSASEDKLPLKSKIELLDSLLIEFPELIEEIKHSLNTQTSNVEQLYNEQISLDIDKINEIIKENNIFPEIFNNIELPKELRFVIKQIKQILTVIEAIEIFIEKNFKLTYSCNALLIHQFRKNRIEFCITDEFDLSTEFNEIFNDLLLSNFDIQIEVLIDILMQIGIMDENITYDNITLVHYE